jgi:hypothetical protein
MAYSRNTIVKQAQSWIGCKESDGSHRKIIDIYNAHKPLARGYAVKYTDAWCATFVSAVSIKCGYTAIIPTECGCPNMIQLFQRLGEWQENDAYVPSPGDVIFYDWQDSGLGDNTGSPDHVGIVEKVSGNTITVIEGNKNDAVGKRTLQVNERYIRGYGVPKYTDNSSSATTATASSGMAKSANEVAKEVLAGKWGNGDARRVKLSAAGYDYAQVQSAVNKLLKGSGATTKASAKAAENPSYKVGGSYTLQVDLNVRTGAGTGCAKKTMAQLTADGRKHANSVGVLLKGTQVTCQQIKTIGSNIWMKIPSGWVAAYYNGNIYIK